MASKKLLVVLGASGVQGSGVIHAILSHPTLSTQFTIRALSRNPSALPAKYPSYPADSISYAHADIDDKSTLIAAFDGAHTVFGVTNYYETRSMQRDVQQGKNIADACVLAGVEHLIWSSMKLARDVSGGEVAYAPGLDGKAIVGAYVNVMKQQGVDGAAGLLRATELLVGFYFSNFAKIFGYETDGSEGGGGAGGQFEFRGSWDGESVRLPLVDASVDVGKFVAGVMLEGPEKMDGKSVQVVSEWATMQEVCDVWKALCQGKQGMRGKEMRYEQVTKREFEDRLPQPLRAEQLAGLVTILEKYELFGKGSRERQKDDDEVVEKAGLKKSTWKEYLERDFEEDFKNPMFPPFMVPYLMHRVKDGEGGWGG